jgi:hypothetical protein
MYLRSITSNHDLAIFLDNKRRAPDRRYFASAGMSSDFLIEVYRSIDKRTLAYWHWQLRRYLLLPVRGPMKNQKAKPIAGNKITRTVQSTFFSVLALL